MSFPKERNLQKAGKTKEYLAKKRKDYVNLIIHIKNESFFVKNVDIVDKIRCPEVFPRFLPHLLRP